MATEDAVVLFTLEVVDLVHGGAPVTYNDVAVKGENLYHAMCQLEAKPGSNFTFQSLLTSYGHYITVINGLSKDDANDNYWTIRIGNLDHWAPVGVDEFYPKQGDKYIFAFTHIKGEHANTVKM
ncbi:hypothetical protein HOLleu_25164 [Holothuria leucospilota]|uniref:Transcobalamin-like C-terminal domain-containing protein n=1 Tax=Holothuria leucospilota TaxID=206669 RepID=A0A9Q1BSM5_HOLLE|nr:hypothetical protein HOLleu_25164 [Holothuria leucospilota]